MDPPGGERDQRERDAAEESGLDALEEPEAARGLVDGVGEPGSVVADAVGDPLEANALR